MGGVLLTLARAGHDLVFAHLTDGEGGTRQPQRGTRCDEARRALDPLGSCLAWAQLPDGGLGKEAGLASWLRETLASGIYDAVFGPHPVDAHPDHAAVGAELRLAVAELPLWHWLDCLGSVAPTHVFVPGLPWTEKEALIRMHGSQIPAPGESRAHLPGGLDIAQRARQRDAALGVQVGKAWGEPFVRAGIQREQPLLLEDPGAFFEGLSLG